MNTNAQTVAAGSKRAPNWVVREKKPPYRPLTAVDLRPLEGGSAEIVVGFRYPVRRVLREGFDEQFAMTPAEALNLYNRLGRAIELERRRWQAARRDGSRGE